MLTGKTNEEKIWNYLTAAGLNACGAAGLMGNLYAESALSPINLQNTFEKKLGYTDAAYTAAVDSGAYDSFVRDSAGYGLAQWTYWSRKKNLLDYAKSRGKSIGDLEMQLDFLMKELSGGYRAVLDVLRTATSVRTASDAVLLQFERPADQSAAVQERRAGYGQKYYDKYAAGQQAEKGSGKTMGYTNSPLVSYTRISPNKTRNRTHKIDTITIHCIVGQWTAKQGCDYFAGASAKSSANYVVGKDGSIGLCGEEKDRSWCTSNAANDHRAVTIEVASDTSSPYAVTDKAYTALLNLVTDICKRNGKTKLLWTGNKTKTLACKPLQNEMVMTVHRWFANKSCPGDYLYSRHGEIAEEVTWRLNGRAAEPAAAAVEKLARLGVINSPNYWKQAVKSGEVKYLDALLVKAAAKITKAGPRFHTVENGVGALVAAGVIDTPDYWLAHYRDDPSLGDLLCALGGAVK